MSLGNPDAVTRADPPPSPAPLVPAPIAPPPPGARRAGGGGWRRRVGRSLGQRLTDDPLRRNSLWLMASMVANQALGAAFWLTSARYFTAATVGLATGITSLMTITSMISNIGAPTALVQLLPGRRSVEEWSTTFSAGVIAAVVASAVGAVIALAFVGAISSHLSILHDHAWVAVLFVLGTTLTSLSSVLDFVMIAEQASELMAIRAFVFGITKLPVLLVPAVTALLTPSLDLILVAWVVGWLCCCALGLRMIRTRLHARARLLVRGTLAEIRMMARNLAGNHFTSLGNVLPTYLLPVIVISRLSTADNAYFYMTWMIGGVFFMISGTIGSALFADGMRSPETLVARVRSSARFTAVLAAPAMLVAIVLGYPILSLFGHAYAARGYTLLLILTVCAVPDAITNLYVAVLRVHDRLRACSLLTMGMAAFALVAAWIVAPSTGLVGIGVAWGVSQALGSLWVAWDVLGPGRRPATGSGAGGE
jgi:O-antigen/teichoic acid export membrane protein